MGRLAVDPLEGFGALRGRDCPEQLPRVGMGGSPENQVRRPVFDHPACVHDGQAVDEPTHDGEVVGDKNCGHAVGTAKAPYGVQYEPLRRHVQAGRGLVEHDHARPQREGHGERHPLLLAAGELVGVGIEQAWYPSETSLVECPGHPRPRIPEALGRHGIGVGAQHLDELRPDLEHRVERRGRVLGDVGHFGAAQLAQLLLSGPHHVGSPDQHGPASHFETPARVAEQGERHGGLAGTGLPHEPHELPGADLERHVVDHVDGAPGQAHTQPVHIDHDVARSAPSGPPLPSSLTAPPRQQAVPAWWQFPPRGRSRWQPGPRRRSKC